MALIRNLLYALRNAESAAWDQIAAEDVSVTCAAGPEIRGREALRAWAVTVARALGCAITLADQHLMLDLRGNGRGFITLTLHCKSNQELIGRPEWDCEWTSSETLLLTVEAHRLVHIYIAGETLDLALRYMPTIAESRNLQDTPNRTAGRPRISSP
jgi:hypothetical protein